MRTIAIINQKGGCGKTTVSINLAATLASMDRRTLLIDMDPQSHCSLGLAVPESQLDRSIGDILRHGLDGSIAVSDATWQINRQLDLVPSTMALTALEQELANSPDKDRRLSQVLSTVEDQYEFCVIDCPPAIGLLTFNALRAAGEVLIPVETGYFSMQGAVRQEETIRMLARRVRHNVRFKVLATMYDVRMKLSREILSALRKQFRDQLLPVVVHFNSKLKEAAGFGQPITEYDATSRGMKDFEKLVGWLLSNPPQPEVGELTIQTSPAISRAAELVERARALSARTAALSTKLTADRSVASHDPVPESRVAVLEEPAAAPTMPKQEPRLSQLYGARSTSQGLLFVQPLSGAKQVGVAGDFNNWDPQRTPLKKDDQLQVWQGCIPVPPGRYRYRIVVDGQWIQDPYNAYVETNPFGELNSVVDAR